MQTKRMLNRFLASCVTFVLLMTSCEIQENFKYEPANVDGELGVTAWEFIQANSDFSQLRTAITLTGLQGLYQDEVRTFIVPNNKAFTAYLASTPYDTVEDIPLPILRNMLRYHVVKDRVIFTDPAIGRDLPVAYETENGQEMFLSRNNNYIGQINQGTARQWEIRTSNLEPTNGVMHAVDFVVYFSAPAVDNTTSLETEEIYPLHDSFVAGFTDRDSDNRGQNYGTQPTLRPKRLPGTQNTPSGEGTYDRRAFLMFDLDQLEKPGIVVGATVRLAVSFARGGYNLQLYKVPSTTWTETAITYTNAPSKEGDPIALAPSISGASFLNFNITDYYQNETPSGRVSFMIDTDPWPNGTDDFASKEHATLAPPTLIVTLAAGVNTLILENNAQATVANGGSTVINDELLKITGADVADIIYTIETAPNKGWFVRGADILARGGQFTQADIQSLSLIYIHDGESSGEDTMVLSAKDRTGATLDDIEIKINIQ